MHCIENNDLVFSDTSSEWHGLARVRRIIDSEVVRPLLFPVRSLPQIGGEIDGQYVTLEGFKALVADRRKLKEEGAAGPDFLPLGLHSQDYQVIENGAVWEALQQALANHPHTVTTAGTLGNLKRFFISVSLSGAEGYKVGNDPFLGFLNFATSHDGTLALQSYDSSVRIVCQNTLNASLCCQGSFQLRVAHIGNDTKFEIREMSRLIDETLQNRVALAGKLEVLQSLPCDRNRAVRLAAGWKYITQEKPEAFGTPTRNTIASIVDLFANGKGNHGQTVYDLFNGVTEYYSTGRGVGVATTPERRASSSLIGGAAAQKADFTRRLIAVEGIERLEAAGREAVDNKHLVSLVC